MAHPLITQPALLPGLVMYNCRFCRVYMYLIILVGLLIHPTYRHKLTCRPFCWPVPALIKSIGLRNDGRLDDRSYWVSHVASLSILLAVPLVYPRMISLHDLTSKVWSPSSRLSWCFIFVCYPALHVCGISFNLMQEDVDISLLSATLPLSSEHLNDDGIYLLENGEDGLIYVGHMVSPDTLQHLFGVSSLDGVPNQVYLCSFA